MLKHSERWDSYRSGPHWVAVFAAVFTWPLLFVGGLVTSYHVGMAVPDWPTTFGINMFLYDFFNSPWGVFIEHTHRLYGFAVGLATIVLVIWFTSAERSNQRMVRLAWFALLAVITQGVLGGLRVNQVSTTLAAIHGCTGQAFFGLMVAIAVMTSRSYREPTACSDGQSRLRFTSLTLVAVIYAQELMGAWLRHFPSRLGLVLHGISAIAVVALGIVVLIQVSRRGAILSALWPSAIAFSASLVFQVSLGLAAWWVLEFQTSQPADLSALIRTGHQANAALLLGSSVSLALYVHRYTGSTVLAYRSEESWNAQLEAVV